MGIQELTVQVDGHVVRLQPGESATIGRGRDCDITIVDVDVSRRHAQVSAQGEGVAGA